MKILIALAGALPIGVGVAIGAPVLEWDHPEPADTRIESYRLHCTNTPPLNLDGSDIVAEVPATETSADLTTALATGSMYECAATSENISLGISSTPSNIVALDMSSIPAPGTLRIRIHIDITP